MARHSSELLPEAPPALWRAVADYLTHLELERGLALNTLDAYARDLGRYLRWLDEQSLTSFDDVGADDLRTFSAMLADTGLAVPSRARIIVAVRRLHGHLHGEGLTLNDPAADLSPPRAVDRLPSALSISQMDDVLRAAGGESAADLRSAALLEFLYATGARISEAVGLDIDELDLRSRIARLYGKGRKERLVPLGSHAIAALDAWLVRGRPRMLGQGGGGRAGAVFLNQRGGRLSRQSAWQAVRSAADRAGLGDRVTPHTFRHSFATHLLEGGADIRVVQELLGHASVTTTQIYTRVTSETLREVYATSHPRAR